MVQEYFFLCPFCSRVSMHHIPPNWNRYELDNLADVLAKHFHNQSLKTQKDIQEYVIRILQQLSQSVHPSQGWEQLSSHQQHQINHIVQSIAGYIAHHHALNPEQIRQVLLGMLLAHLKKMQEKFKETEKEQDKSNDKEHEERKKRMLIYDAHKALNPNQLAGETRRENFENNLQHHGLNTALKNAGKEYGKHLAGNKDKFLDKILPHSGGNNDGNTRGR